jgi:hypothetical protein
MLEGDRRQEFAAVMDEVAQYREYAGECRGLAAAAKNPEYKKQLLEMAAAWDTVARQQKVRAPRCAQSGRRS